MRGSIVVGILAVGALAALWYYVQFVLWRGVRLEARAVWIWARLHRRAEARRRGWASARPPRIDPPGRAGVRASREPGGPSPEAKP